MHDMVDERSKIIFSYISMRSYSYLLLNRPDLGNWSVSLSPLLVLIFIVTVQNPMLEGNHSVTVSV
jgi:hypothetical protein